MHIRSLEEAPSVSAYLHEMQQEESRHQFQPVPAGKLTLTPGGMLMAGGDTFEVAEEAQPDLAKLARIPLTYFDDAGPELRAVNFNARLRHLVGSDEILEVMVSNDKAVHRVQRPRFGQLQPSQLVEAVVDGVAGTVSNNIRVVKYEHDRRLDLAVVSRALQAEPRRGDIICGGVHVTIEENGAVQVGPESFRLVCLNGAMARVCAPGQHRLRRGEGKHSDHKFMAKLREFARSAWSDWEHIRTGLSELVTRPLSRDGIERLIQSLRQTPFFLSAQAARRVPARWR